MNTHGIQRVARLTVLSKDVIRVWERRYGIVQPVRSATRYRTYTDEDVALPRDISRHHVTNQVRQKLSSAMSHLPVHEKGLRVVVACPAGEFHEVGAQAAAYTFASRGCQTYYLGSNMPMDELTTFCRHIDPDVLLLSVTAPPPAPEWSSWVATLAIFGGAGAQSLSLPADARRIEIFDDLPRLQERLTGLIAKRAAHAR